MFTLPHPTLISRHLEKTTFNFEKIVLDFFLPNCKYHADIATSWFFICIIPWLLSMENDTFWHSLQLHHTHLFPIPILLKELIYNFSYIQYVQCLHYYNHINAIHNWVMRFMNYDYFQIHFVFPFCYDYLGLSFANFSVSLLLIQL